MSMKNGFFSILAAGMISITVINQNINAQDADALSLFYDKPAVKWVEALPIGNGRLGAMIYGGAQTEQIQFNEDTFWAGSPYDPSNPDAYSRLDDARKLIFAGKEKAAQDMIHEYMMGKPMQQASYQPVGDIMLEFEGHGKPAGYKRTLNIADATAEVTYTIGNVVYTREIFSSFADNVIVVRISGSEPGSVSFKASLSSPQERCKISALPGVAIGMSVTGPDINDTAGHIECVSILKATIKNGTRVIEDNRIAVKNADSAILFLACHTNYVNYNDLSGEPAVLAEKAIERVERRLFDQLKAAHTKIYGTLFNRVQIDLGTTSAARRTTDKRISEFRESNDPQLVALYFQFGRYLLISSSMPGTQPANLQGIWNDNVTPPWASKYTVNINTEMNYWPAESTNLAECHQPLFDLIADISKTGRKTAQAFYNANGWVCHHNTDIWRATAPISSAFYGFWPTGGAWLCQHLWYRYEYGGDREFLEYAYPIMKGAAEFFVDTLVEDPHTKWLVTVPSLSPENAVTPGVSICSGPTMDSQIIRDLFGNCITASKILGKDEEFRKLLEEKRGKLAPSQIGKAGQLQEWLKDIDLNAPEINHRHVSHLYGLFPSSQINAKDTPELFAAARKSLTLRGDGGTGWSKAWKINLWARLQDGNRAHLLLTSLITTGTYPNMFDAHPPFQIDGNFGATSGICEMLMQSYSQYDRGELGGRILLLPALPDKLATGSITGLRARGGFGVYIKWQDGSLVETIIVSDNGNPLTVEYKGRTITTSTLKGQVIRLDKNLKMI